MTRDEDSEIHESRVQRALFDKPRRLESFLVASLHEKGVGVLVPDFEPELTKRQISDGPSALLPTPY